MRGEVKALMVPATGLLVLAALLHSGIVVPSAAFVSYAFPAACLAGILLAWRFHSSRIFFSLIILWLGQEFLLQARTGNNAETASFRMAVFALGLLWPLNFILLSFLQEKGLTASRLGAYGLFIFIQGSIAVALCRPDPILIARAGKHAAVHANQSLPLAAQLCFAVAAAVLLVRLVLFRKPAENGLLWALLAAFAALRFGGVGRIPGSYLTAAAVILAGAVVETSYLLAYHDELTGLPSRRAFNEALLRLQPPFSIAIVDIDHFKRCNDTYGHDTGDQVLRLVASKLSRVSGNGEAYRCGGEEFAIIFPGKTAPETLECLEDLRSTVEGARLRLRGEDRRREPRGLDRRHNQGRRTPVTRGRLQTGRAIRQLAHAGPVSEVSVTVSIGVAHAASQKSSPHDVIRAADRCLYRAKDEGRNRVEIATSGRRTMRAKSAGIA